jgi:orotate phosphoribosyltransferase
MTLPGRLYRTAHLTGEFVLRSGMVATEYFDKYRFEADPRLLAELTPLLAGLLPADAEVLAGLELGGVPLATSLSLHTGLSACFVRKKAKEYGTRRLAEGADISGRRVVIVEDVATTGGQIVASAGELRDRGAIVESAVVVIDRESGGRAALADIGLELRALYTMTELRNAADVH